MKILFVENIYDFLSNIHKNNCHCSFDKFRKEMINKRFYYKGIIKDLQFVINNWVIYKIKNSKIRLKEKKNYKFKI